MPNSDYNQDRRITKPDLDYFNRGLSPSREFQEATASLQEAVNYKLIHGHYPGDNDTDRPSSRLMSSRVSEENF